MVTDSSAVFQAVADPTRRSMVALLSRREQHVEELARNFDVSRPAISKHLRILNRARMVRERRDGRRRVYSVDHAPLEHVEQWVREVRVELRKALGRLKAHVESNP